MSIRRHLDTHIRPTRVKQFRKFCKKFLRSRLDKWDQQIVARSVFDYPSKFDTGKQQLYLNKIHKCLNTGNFELGPF